MRRARTVGTVVQPEAALEWQPTCELRWVIRYGWDGYERALQQKWMAMTLPTPTEAWRDVPIVEQGR